MTDSLSLQHYRVGSYVAILRNKEAFIIPIMNAPFIYEVESPEPSRRFRELIMNKSRIS